MTLNKLRDQIHEWACRKGWWPKKPNIGEKLMLVVTELAEAMEDYRRGSSVTYFDPNEWVVDDKGKRMFKPCGFASEIADTFIRLLDLCGHLGIDIEREIALKMKYNEHRAHRHGGKRA